jgi:hypothetical protein
MMAQVSHRRRKIPTPPGFLGTRIITVYDPTTGVPVQTEARIFRAPTNEEQEDRKWLHREWRCNLEGNWRTPPQTVEN